MAFVLVSYSRLGLFWYERTYTWECICHSMNKTIIFIDDFHVILYVYVCVYECKSFHFPNLVIFIFFCCCYETIHFIEMNGLIFIKLKSVLNPIFFHSAREKNIPRDTPRFFRNILGFCFIPLPPLPQRKCQSIMKWIRKFCRLFNWFIRNFWIRHGT